jgi:hypothetical protein
VEILLFSDSKSVFEKTKLISKGWFELTWWKYSDLQKVHYPFANIVIMHFDRVRILEGIFLPIVEVRSKMGMSIPILTIIDGTPQEIYSVLKSGVYDYITTIEDKTKYKKRIEEMALWYWYLNKFKKT